MTTFFLFANEKHYPNGGAEDYVDSFPTIEEAKAAIVGLKVNSWIPSDAFFDEVEGRSPEWADIAQIIEEKLVRVAVWDSRKGWSNTPVQSSWKRWHGYDEPETR